MNAWKLAKALIQACDSPGEVAAVVDILSSDTRRSEVKRMLLELSGRSHPALDDQPKPEQRRHDVDLFHDQPKPEQHRHDVDLSVAERILALFRRKGMSNKDAEDWIRTKYQLNYPLGKQSLRSYVQTILRKEGMTWGAQVLTSLLNELSPNDPQLSDLRKYWDELDQRRSEPPAT